MPCHSLGRLVFLTSSFSMRATTPVYAKARCRQSCTCRGCHQPQGAAPKQNGHLDRHTCERPLSAGLWQPGSLSRSQHAGHGTMVAARAPPHAALFLLTCLPTQYDPNIAGQPASEPVRFSPYPIKMCQLSTPLRLSYYDMHPTTTPTPFFFPHLPS